MNEEIITNSKVGSEKAAKLALEAMQKYGAGNGALILYVLDEMRPFDSDKFNEKDFWRNVEEIIKRADEL